MRSTHRRILALTTALVLSLSLAPICLTAQAATPQAPSPHAPSDSETIPSLGITWGAYNKLSAQEKSDYEFSYKQSKKNPGFSLEKWNQMSSDEREDYRNTVRLQAIYTQKVNSSNWVKVDVVPQAVLDYLIKEKVYDTGGSYENSTTFYGHFSNQDLRHTDVLPPSADVRAWLEQNLGEAVGQQGPQSYTGYEVRNYVLNYQRATVASQFINDWDVARTGSDAALIAQLEAHPGAYAKIVRAVGTTDVAKIRKYIKEQVKLATDDFDEAAINATVFQTTQKDKRQETLIAGNSLVGSGPGGIAGGGASLKAFQDEFLALVAKVNAIEVQIRARMKAGLPLDLTNGDVYTTLAFENIYPDSYDASFGGRVTATGSLFGMTPSSAGNSLSSGGMSLSSIGWSLSAAGTSLSSAGSAGLPGQGDPYFRVSAGDTRTIYSDYAARPLAETNPDLAMALYGPLWSLGNESPYAGLYDTVPNRSLYLTRYDRDGTLSALTDPGGLAGFLDQERAARLIASGDIQGLNRLLAQPFNVLVTWGSQLYDLDLHMTGPGVDDPANRFHIYFAARGDQLTAPFAELIKDCICSSGSEVMLTTQLQKGGVYRISAFNYGNQSASSTQLSSSGDVILQIVRGGQAVSQGSGTTIVGGTTIFKGSPQAGQAGNTWTAVEINPNNGGIYFVNKVTSVSGSENVQ